MIFIDDFLGVEEAGNSTEFSGGDDIEKYNNNLLIQPEDWIYRTLKISYDYNKRGHRCKDIEDINLDNYILFIGCSHTEGVGVRLEDSYPFIVSNELKCDYYNLSMSGTGVDVVEYNLVTWLSKVIKKPKYIFVQWPDHSRFVASYPGYSQLINHGTWTDDLTTQKFIASSEHTGLVHARKQISYKMIKEIAGVPVIDVHFSSLSPYASDCMWLKKIDLGRDLLHTGIKSHQSIAKEMVSYIQSL